MNWIKKKAESVLTDEEKKKAEKAAEEVWDVLMTTMKEKAVDMLVGLQRLHAREVESHP